MTWELWLYLGTLGLIVAFALACLISIACRCCRY